MRNLIYSIEKDIKTKKGKSIRADKNPTTLPKAVVTEGWSGIERALIKAYFSHTTMIALGRKGSRVAEPVVHLDLLTRDLLFIVEMEDRINDPKIPNLDIKLSREFAQFFESVKQSFKMVRLEFEYFKMIDEAMIVNLNLSALQHLILNLLVGVTSIMVFYFKMLKPRTYKRKIR
jgi:hypothetical protein